MYYNRKLLNDLLPVLDDKEILVITGMRRVGKTTLLRKLFEQIPSSNKLILDLENPLNQLLFHEKDYDQILINLRASGLNANEKIFLFLDEIQTVPEIVPAIKYLFDHYDIKFVLTGSSSFYLKNLFPESLAGRKYLFELYPLCFEEFLGFHQVQATFASSWKEKDANKTKYLSEKYQAYYLEYLQHGAFPQIALIADIDKKKRSLVDIFNAYFDKEVAQLADFRYLNKFRDLLFLLMKRVGSRLDITKLSQECGVSRDTVYAYLTFLEKTYFMEFLAPFTLNVDREISGSRKPYFADHGILQMMQAVPTGTVLENAVMTQLRVRGCKMQYYQKRNGKEIDFILDQQIALEVKETGTPSDYAELKKTCQILGIKEYYIVTLNYVDLPGFIPASMV
jgi:uncharacterized protein